MQVTTCHVTPNTNLECHIVFTFIIPGKLDEPYLNND